MASNSSYLHCLRFNAMAWFGSTAVSTAVRPLEWRLPTRSKMAAAFDINGFIGRATQQMAATPWFSQVAPKLLPPLDRTLHRLTGGRFPVSRPLVPSLVLTTTGRRSGVPRDAPTSLHAR